MVFAQYELRPWPPPCQLIQFNREDYKVVSPLVCRPLVTSSCQLIVPPSRQLVAPACCHIASPCPLIVLPYRCLVVPAGCRTASRCHLVAPPSRQLVAPACCCIASPRPLVAPRAALSSSLRTGWLLRRLLTCRHLVVSSSRSAASHCHVTPAGCCAIISCCSLVAPPSCPLIVLAGCCFACPCAALSSSRRSPSTTPSNAVECCCNIKHICHRRH